MDLQRLVEKFFDLSNIVAGLVARFEIAIADWVATKLKADNTATELTRLDTRFTEYVRQTKEKEEAESRNEQTEALTQPQHRQSTIAIWALAVSIGAALLMAGATIYGTVYVTTHQAAQSITHH